MNNRNPRKYNSPKKDIIFVDDENMQIRWRHFLRSLHDPDIPFSQVMDGITAFIEPLWKAFLKEEEYQKRWSAEKKNWE